jgi:methanesulfonate monooxygenase small subunit
MSAKLNENRVDVEELVYQSCMMMDENDFGGFLGLCDTGFEYMLTAYSHEIKKDMTFLDHDRKELKELFDLLPRHNSDRSPLTRNAIVYKVDFDDAKNQANVVSALQIFKTSQDGGRTGLFAVGKYHDTVSLKGAKPMLVKRHVKLVTRDLGVGSHIPF